MSWRARVLLAVVVFTAGCGITDGGPEGLSEEWLAFDPCQLGDSAAAAQLLGVKEVTTEVIETLSMFAEEDVITGKNCIFDSGGIGRRVSIWFGEGSESLDRGGRLIDLPGVGDEAGMTVNDGEYDPERDGEILGIVSNVAGMSIIVMPPSKDAPREGSAQADQLVEIARIAADRMSAAAATG